MLKFVVMEVPVVTGAHPSRGKFFELGALLGLETAHWLRALVLLG